MNFIAGSFLYHAEEYITFWLLVMAFELFEMRDIYQNGTPHSPPIYNDILLDLPGLAKHSQIIDFLIFNKLHKLYSHFVSTVVPQIS